MLGQKFLGLPFGAGYLFLSYYLLIFNILSLWALMFSQYNQLKALGIDKILGFDWPASPSPEAMIRALEVLYSLGVLDDDAKLTSPTGFQLAEIPLVRLCHDFILIRSSLGQAQKSVCVLCVSKSLSNLIRHYDLLLTLLNWTNVGDLLKNALVELKTCK